VEALKLFPKLESQALTPAVFDVDSDNDTFTIYIILGKENTSPLLISKYFLLKICL